MRLVSYAGITFATYGITHATIIRGLPGVNRTVDILPRRGGVPAVVGATNTSRPVPCLFTVENIADERVTEHRLRRLLGLMNVDSEEARTLVCEIDVDADNNGTIDAQVQVQVQAVCGAWKWRDGGMRAIELTFDAVSTTWEAVTPTTDGPDTINIGSPTTVWANSSNLAVAPVITRSTHASFTTTDRHPVTVTNGSVFPLERETVVTRMGDLTSTGNAQDFTVLKDGNYLSGLTFSDAGGYVPFVQFPGGAPAQGSELYYVLEADMGVAPPSYTKFDGNYSALDLEYVYVTATSGGATTFVVSGATWETNRFTDASLVIVAGTGAGQARWITSNTSDTITTQRAWTKNPGAGSVAVIVTSGIWYHGGRASSATASSIVDSSVSWENIQWAGGTVTTMAGTGSGQTRTITSTGTNTLNVSPNWTVTPDNTTVYIVERLGYHRYYVDQVNHAATHRGVWQQSARYTRPGKIVWGSDVLNGWAPFKMLDNNDDFNQLRTSDIDVGGSLTHYFPILNATRRRGQDRRLPEERQADGVVVYHPCGFTYYKGEIRYTNQNSAPGATEGIGQIALMVRLPGGDEFQNTTGSFKTLAATETTTPLSAAIGTIEPPTYVYVGVLPNDGVEISRDAAESDIVNAAWDDQPVVVATDPTKYSVTVGSAEACIEINDEIRIGDYALQIGMRDGQRLWMKNADQSLVLDCANARAYITETGEDDIDVTYAVTPVVYSGTDYRIADRWPVLEPGNNTVTCSGAPWASAGQFALSVSFQGGYLG